MRSSDTLATMNLLPVNYFELGMLKSKSVGRIQYRDLTVGKVALATGFLISPKLVMTNHHVFEAKENFADPIIEFDYEYGIDGKEKKRITFNLNPNKFFIADKDLDVAVIGVDEIDITGKIGIETRGYLVLNEALGKIGKGDFASIIQHPEGKPKMIGLRENKILDIKQPIFITYTTDTTIGSSGAAVMNDQFQIIALHSAGVGKRNAKGEYVDKDGVPIPKDENGKVDGALIVWESNRGTRVSSIMEFLRTDAYTKSHPFVLDLFSPTYSDAKQLAFLSHPSNTETAKPAENRIIEAPRPAVSPSNIHIVISLDGKAPIVATPATAAGLPAVAEAFEKKFEDGMDFSQCDGFDEYFLGQNMHTPIPKLSAKLKAKVAHYLDNPNRYVLKYHHFSSIQHAVRRQPIIAAININGLKRYEELTGRTDKWYRDNRIDYDVQLNDDFYKYSGFDKGHLCRREDAEWGSPMSFAELAANMTCSYANASPQVPTLNRGKYGYTGKWGRLEIEILEKGVAASGEKERKIVVFNGPIFKDDDPVFKGVQIPLHFYKVVVWRDADKNPRTTAFLLHQDRLVQDIEFELAYDQVFVHSQCSIAYLEQLTDLTFTNVRNWDTYKASNDNPNERIIE